MTPWLPTVVTLVAILIGYLKTVGVLQKQISDLGTELRKELSDLRVSVARLEERMTRLDEHMGRVEVRLEKVELRPAAA